MMIENKWLVDLDIATRIPTSCCAQENAARCAVRPQSLYTDPCKPHRFAKYKDTLFCMVGQLGFFAETYENENRCSCLYCACSMRTKSLAHSYVECLNEHIKSYCDQPLEIIPIGSSKCGTKVLNDEEFDFLLVFEQSSMSDKECANSKEMFQNFENCFLEFQDSIRMANQLEDRPHITSVYKHGPAWCVEVGWSNTTISIDLTLGVRHKGHSLKDYSSSLLDYQLFSDEYNGINEDVIFVNLNPEQRGYTHSTLDRRMFEKLGLISENIPMAYRLMKVFMSLMLPKKVMYCPFRHQGYRESSYIDSHYLKNLLYRQVVSYPTPEDWSLTALPDRLIMMLQSLYDNEMQKQDFIHDKSTSREARSLNRLLSVLRNPEPIPYSEKAIQSQDVFCFVKERDYHAASIDQIKELLKQDQQEPIRHRLVYFTNNILLRNTEAPMFPALRTYLLCKLNDLSELNLTKVERQEAIEDDCCNPLPELKHSRTLSGTRISDLVPHTKSTFTQRMFIDAVKNIKVD